MRLLNNGILSYEMFSYNIIWNLLRATNISFILPKILFAKMTLMIPNDQPFNYIVKLKLSSIL